MKYYDRYHRVPGIQLEFKFPGLTEQHHKDDCDLNVIMNRYMKTGVLGCDVKSPVYGDFTNAADFREAQDMIIRAREAFEALPSKVRDRFNNDPAQLMDFLDDPENEAEARSLGLLSTESGASAAGARESCVPASGATAPGDKAEAPSEAEESKQ